MIFSFIFLLIVYTYLFPQLSIFLNVKRVLITAIYFWYIYNIQYIYNITIYTINSTELIKFYYKDIIELF